VKGESMANKINSIITQSIFPEKKTTNMLIYDPGGNDEYDICYQRLKIRTSGPVHFGSWTNVVITFNSSRNTTLDEGTYMHH
jgi:hypothetical protein